MKPVMQTDFGQFGNCFSACLASLFELPLEKVPNFFTVAGPYDDAAWWAAVRDWLRPRGYGIMFNNLRDPEHLKLFEGYFIVSGKSSRNVDHATIWKDGVMVHDPHPEQCGLIAPDGVDLIYPLDVAAPPCPDAGLPEEIANRVWKEQGWASRRNDNHLSSEWNLCLAAVKATLRGGRHD